MKIKILIGFIINLLFIGIWLKPVFALEHTQKDGLFSMDLPAGWRWMEYPREIIITYPDGKTMAVDIQMVASQKLSQAEIKKYLKDTNDKMIKEGVEAHNGTLIDNKEMNLDGVYATRLDFKTALSNSIDVTYISFFYRDYAVTMTYGSSNDIMHEALEDCMASLKFK